jgi:hypothetical protein
MMLDRCEEYASHLRNLYKFTGKVDDTTKFDELNFDCTPHEYYNEQLNLQFLINMEKED